jgi:hypothetical protein
MTGRPTTSHAPTILVSIPLTVRSANQSETRFTTESSHRTYIPARGRCCSHIEAVTPGRPFRPTPVSERGSHLVGSLVAAFSWPSCLVANHSSGMAPAHYCSASEGDSSAARLDRHRQIGDRSVRTRSSRSAHGHAGRLDLLPVAAALQAARIGDSVDEREHSGRRRWRSDELQRRPARSSLRCRL